MEELKCSWKKSVLLTVVEFQDRREKYSAHSMEKTKCILIEIEENVPAAVHFEGHCPCKVYTSVQHLNSSSLLYFSFYHLETACSKSNQMWINGKIKTSMHEGGAAGYMPVNCIN